MGSNGRVCNLHRRISGRHNFAAFPTKDGSESHLRTLGLLDGTARGGTSTTLALATLTTLSFAFAFAFATSLAALALATVLLLTSVIDADVTAIELLTVEGGHSLLRGVGAIKLDVAKSTWLSSLAVGGESYESDSTGLSEKLPHHVLSYVPREVTDKALLASLWLFRRGEGLSGATLPLWAGVLSLLNLEPAAHELTLVVGDGLDTALTSGEGDEAEALWLAPVTHRHIEVLDLATLLEVLLHILLARVEREATDKDSLDPVSAIGLGLLRWTLSILLSILLRGTLGGLRLLIPFVFVGVRVIVAGIIVAAVIRLFFLLGGGLRALLRSGLLLWFFLLLFIRAVVGVAVVAIVVRGLLLLLLRSSLRAGLRALLRSGLFLWLFLFLLLGRIVIIVVGRIVGGLILLLLARGRLGGRLLDNLLRGRLWGRLGGFLCCFGLDCNNGR